MIQKDLQAGSVDAVPEGMVRVPWRSDPISREKARDFFMMVVLEDDTEDAPWMVMGDLQFWSASAFAHSLRNYALGQGLSWYVAAMMPILFTWRNSPRKHQLAPDVFVAFVPDRPRQNFDVAVEGGFPPFVVEVTSPSSIERDKEEKLEAYGNLGVREYVIFTPRQDEPSALEGYRRGSTGSLEPWPADEQGRLRSDVLGLYLVLRGRQLQAETPDGQLLLTPEQEAGARRRAEAERAREAEERARETAARRQAEAELERLRQELERRRTGGADIDPRSS